MILFSGVGYGYGDNGYGLFGVAALVEEYREAGGVHKELLEGA